MSKSNLDEYIKRGDAMEAVEDDYNLCFAMDPTIPQDFAYYKVKRAAVRAIARVHPANVKPVVLGEWKRIDEYVYGEKWQCTCCEETNQWRARFCPNCGADMREEERG